jgi:signal transduction histidine kinase/ActR/RegA family two-component response regulator
MEVGADVWHRVLVLAPVGRDASLICSVLSDAGILSHRCDTAEALISAFHEGAGAMLLTEEAMTADLVGALGRQLAQQPPWSDLPIMILVGQALSGEKPRSFSQLGRRAAVTLVDRPVRMKSLVTATESALRFRERQYEVRDLLGKLEERVHERDRFLAILGHELRNPLGAILLATQMVDPKDGRLDAEHVTRIDRQSRHLTRLVNDLLDLSRVTSGKIILKKSIINLKEIIDQALQTVRPRFDEHQLTVRFECSPDAMLVDGDGTRLDQIISNVLTNAIKYTPPGGSIDVVVECSEDEAHIHVRDTGVGIAPEKLGMIFELFGQAENAIGRSQGGMGIGLALVRNLVELHGGTVTAKSDGIGKGSEFTITFPLAKGAELAESRTEAEAMPMVGDGRRRIVIVEDNPDVRDLLKMRLMRLGHRVEAASEGNSGLAKVLKVQPDVAFIDIGLPGIDGYQIAEKVREALGENIILVALSGFGQPEDKKKAIESGFDQHLTKPVELHDLEAVLVHKPAVRQDYLE